MPGVTNSDDLSFLQRRDSEITFTILKEVREESASTKLLEIGGSSPALRRMPWMVRVL